MNSYIPWQIDGVDRQARDTAQEAARRAGLSLGQWLDAIILNSARQDLPPARTDGTRPGDRERSDPASPTLSFTQAGHRAPQDIQPGAFTLPGRAAASPLDAERPAGGEDAFMRAAELVERLTLIRAGDHPQPLVDEGFARLNERLDGLTLKLSEIVAAHVARPATEERHSGEAPARLFEALDRKLDQLASAARPAGTEREQRGNDSDPADVPGNPLDQALLEIADRQRMLDGGARAAAATEPTASPGSLPRARTQDLSGLERLLRQINTQIEQLKQPGSLDKAVETLCATTSPRSA